MIGINIYEYLFFKNYLENLEIKNNEFEKKNLTLIMVRKIINKIKNKFKNFSIIKKIIFNKNSIFNRNESDLNQINAFFEKINIYNLTEQDIKPFKFVKNPKISIVIPIYNSQNMIFQIVKNIQFQSLKDIEIIFIDDCSSDNTNQIILKLQKKDQRIILLKNKKNKGPFYSRNKGAIFSRGEYIQFVDSDDMLDKQYFGKSLFNSKK